MNPTYIIAIYVIGVIAVQVYAGWESEKNTVAIPLSMFWPVVLGLFIFAAPFLLAGWLGKAIEGEAND